MDIIWGERAREAAKKGFIGIAASKTLLDKLKHDDDVYKKLKRK